MDYEKRNRTAIRLAALRSGLNADNASIRDLAMCEGIGKTLLAQVMKDRGLDPADAPVVRRKHPRRGRGANLDFVDLRIYPGLWEPLKD